MAGLDVLRRLIRGNGANRNASAHTNTLVRHIWRRGLGNLSDLFALQMLLFHCSVIKEGERDRGERK